MAVAGGYLIGNMLGGRSGMAFQPSPMYKTADGKFTNRRAPAPYSSNKGAAKLKHLVSSHVPATNPSGTMPLTRATANRARFLARDQAS